MKIIAAYILSVCCTFALWALAKTYGIESNVVTVVLCLFVSMAFMFIFMAAFKE